MDLSYKRISVIGGGNIGTQVACVCASKECDVTVYSSRPYAYDGTLEIVDANDCITTGKMKSVTSSLKNAIEESEFVFVTYPAFKLKELAEEMLPFVKRGIVICVMPGTGGAEFAFSDCIRAGAVLCGLQRVPSVARLEQYGKRVRCEGLRNELFLAAIPADTAEKIAMFISSLWGIPCHVLPNYLSVTLTPSNPILHTARLSTLFRNYKDGKVYSKNPLFYGEWNDESSELLIACDEELQELCKKLTKLDMSNVRSLKLHYESETVKAMTEKLCSIKSLHNLHSPMIQTNNGWIPDFQSRYFTADFPYGLAIIEDLGKIVAFEMPNICKTMDWYRSVTGNTEHFKFSDYGIYTVDDLYGIYKQ
mgnify:FL=1